MSNSTTQTTEQEPPATRPMDFEVTGYFEEIFDNETLRCVGSITIADAKGRKLGSDGREDLCFTKPFQVERGGKVHDIPASEAKPFRGWSMLQPICGRAKWRHPMEL